MFYDLLLWFMVPCMAALFATMYEHYRQTRYDRALLQQIVAMRNTPIDPATAQTVSFRIDTLPLANSLLFPAAIRQINTVALSTNDGDILLQPVDLSVDMARYYNYIGRPSFYQVLHPDNGLEVLLWPIPDAVYSLQVLAFTSLEENMLPNPSAHDKAFHLLETWLTPTQLELLACHGYFMVKGSESGQRYRIYKGTVFNVTRLNAKGTSIGRMCLVPDNAPYVGDVMLAQKIMLETDETRACEIANKQPARGVEHFPA